VISINRMVRPEGNSMKSPFRDMDMAIRKVLKACEGVSVDQTDFQWLVSFKSVTKAVQAALAIQLFNKKFSKDLEKDKINVKIGLSSGVPVTKKQLIFEDTIKLAERMCELVKGEIMLTVEVRDLYKSENANTFIKGRGIITLSQAEEKFITGLMDFADASWTKVDLKVEDFTKPLGYSKSQLYRKMISVTGKSPNTFIRDYRLKEALKLLRKNTGNISEIAFETGFSSPSYFSKCFQKRYGHSPSDYLHAATG
jgi:AraC-like DNA-binding protein